MGAGFGFVIRLLSDRLNSDWESPRLDLTLRSIINDAASYMYRVWNDDIYITCLLRTPEEDAALYHDPQHQPGVHVYGRGCDLSVRSYSLSEVNGLVNYVNENWQYDPARPMMLCALYEDATHPDSSGAHIHLQSHLDTAKIIHVADSEVTAT